MCHIQTDKEEEYSGMKEEKEPPDEVWTQKVLTHISDVKEEDTVPGDQDHLQSPHIKEEQEEAWPQQDLPLTGVHVKSEDDDQGQTGNMKEEECGPGHEDRSAESEDSSAESEDSSAERDFWNHASEHPSATKSRDKKQEVWKSKLHCSVCRKSFDFRSALKTHMRVHTGEKPFNCSVCGKKFARKEALVPHMRVHTGEKPFGCSVCGKRFSQKGNVRDHMARHVEAKPNGCPGPQNTSVETHTRQEVDVISCSVCGQNFVDQSSLRDHVRDHPTTDDDDDDDGDGEEDRPTTGVADPVNDVEALKQHMCPECGKSFVCKAKLDIHLRIHTGERPFSCSLCGKKFTSNSTLTAHMTVHTGDKPHACPECGKRFSQKTGVERHMRLHTGEKPFSCDICHKRFKHKHHVQKHMKVHKRQ